MLHAEKNVCDASWKIVGENIYHYKTAGITF